MNAIVVTPLDQLVPAHTRRKDIEADRDRLRAEARGLCRTLRKGTLPPKIAAYFNEIVTRNRRGARALDRILAKMSPRPLSRLPQPVVLRRAA